LAGSEDLRQNLQEVLDRTLGFLAETKSDVFNIVESARKELQNIKAELEMVEDDIEEVIEELDEKERINRRARRRLMEVSRDFDQYSEEEVKEVYERAEDSSVEIAVLREKEKQLQDRRRKLEEKYQSTEKTLERSQNLINRLSMVRGFLEGRMEEITDQFEDMQDREKFVMKIIKMQEEERKRVAREIHDGPAQSLANLVMRVEVAQNMLHQDVEKADEELEELKSIVRSSVKDVRKIIYDLRPMSLDDLGLMPTLRRYVDDFVDDTGIDINFEVMGEEKNLPSTHEITAFRLVQEALNNIRKHSQAKSGSVRLEFASEFLNILITDSGVGFDPAEDNLESYGLTSMRERCNLLDGELTIKSSRNSGTRIRIKLPLKLRKDDSDV